MVSTNNLQRIYSAHSPDLQTFLVEAMPRYVLIKKKRSEDVIRLRNKRA